MAVITVDRSTNADDAFAMTGAARVFLALPTASATGQYNVTGYTNPWVTAGANMPVSSNWQSLVYGNNLVVAVSSTSGTIAASTPDGTTWTARVMPSTASWYAIEYGLNLFVAVSGGASTAAGSSPDGAVWTSRTISQSGDWRCIAFGQGTFVTLSYGSANGSYSTNGTTWTNTGALPATRNWSSVAWGENTFVAVATTATNKGAYSTDGGLTWQEMTMPSTSSWTSVTYGNGTFVAVATGTTAAAYSLDGITWLPAVMPASVAWIAVKFGNNRFVAVSTSTTSSAISDDGISWRANVQVSQALTCLAYTPWTWNSGDTLTITNNSTVTVNSDQGKFWSGITLTNGKLVISNTSTSTGIRFTMGQTTTDAVTNIVPGSGIGDIEISGNWIELGTGSGSSAQTMTAPFSDYIPALWVETATGSGVYEQWLNVTGTYGDSNPLLLNGLSAVGKNARGKFFIQQAASTPYGPVTINGTLGSRNQKLITVTDSAGLYAGASVRGPGIPLNTVVNRVISSTQIELNAVVTTEVSPNWSSVAYGNSTYVAVSTSQSNIAATSTDGVTWTKRTLPFVAHWNSVCYGATSGLFVAVASDTLNAGANTPIGCRFVATSADGITWTRRALQATQNWTSVATNGTSFVAVGSLSDGTATTIGAYSADGLTWSNNTMTSAIWRTVTYGAGAANRYVAVSSTTLSNWDADGTGTWTNGGAMTSANYLGLAWNGTRFFAVSGSSTVSMYSTDAVTWTTGAVLANSTSTGVAWDGTNFVIVSTTNSVNTSRTPNGSTAVTNTTMASTLANNWVAICANGTTLVAVSNSSNLRSAAMTSTDSGANWTLRTGTPMDVSLTCFNPFVSQLTTTVQFGDNVNGNKVPTGAKVRCPNIMFTCATPASVKTAAGRTFGANILMLSGSFSGGSVIADKCLFDDSYNNFTQSEILTLTNVAFSTPPLIAECYNVTMTSVGFALEPVRRYYQASATMGSYGWFTRDLRFGQSSVTTWSYINNAVISDFNVAIGQPLGLLVNQTGSTVAAPGYALNIQSTENSTWTDIRFYGLNISKNFQNAISASALFNNNTITNFESYALAPIYLGTSSGNTITNVTWSEDMWNGYKNVASAYRIGNDPIAEAKLENDTKYYIKTRSFRDSTNRSLYYESRAYSTTPFIGSKYFPQALSAVNNGPRSVILNWVQRNPTSGTVSYTIFRGTSANFTRDSTSRLYYTPTAATVTVTNGFVATATAAAVTRIITFNQAGRTITASGTIPGSFITDGFAAGMNVVASGFSSNNGTYMILSLTATVITLTTNHTNLTTSGGLTAGTLDGQAPANGTAYYYRLLKLDSGLSGITNAAGTATGTALTIPSGSFNTGLGTIINCEGISGQTKIRIPIGSTTNFLAGNVSPGMQISGGGVGASATVVSIDSLWQITVSVANASTFSAATLSLGASAGLYIYGPGIAWPTKVVSVDSATSITVDTAFLATFTGQTITFMYGTESPEIEVPVVAQTTAAFNFLSQSDDFTHANWVKTGITATASVLAAPIDIPQGNNITQTLYADRLLSTAPTATCVQTLTNLESGTVYTFSVYVMTVTGPHQLTVDGKISINTTVATDQSFTATNLWQRITASFTATSTTHTFTIQINTQGAFIYVATAQVDMGGTALAPVTQGALKFGLGSAKTLSFATAGSVNTINAVSGNFTTDGFVAGNSIIVTGTTSNDGTYLLTAVAALTLTITPAQPFVTETSISTGAITGSAMDAAGQELSAVYAWGRATSGNTQNQGIELTLGTAPAAQHYTEYYLGTTSGFTPSDYNRVGYSAMAGSPAPFSLSNSSNNKIDTVTQAGFGGLGGALVTLTGSAENKFFNFTTDFNFAANTAMVASVQNLSNNNAFDNFTIKGWRNYISAFTPFTFLNNASGINLSNINFDTYDFPIYTTNTNSALGITMKGVSGGSHSIVNAATLTNQNLDVLGIATNPNDGIGIAFVTVYDTIFHETYSSPTTGALQLRFNASALDTPPYTVLSGTPTFSNAGQLYMRNAGDSIEYVWPHKIYTVSGFRDLIPKLSSLDMGHTSALDAAYSVKVEYAIDTGSGYGSYTRATPANLASETVSTTTGFNLKLKLTARPGMMFSTQTNAFVVGETIEGATSGATAVVDELYQLTTTTGTIILSSVTGTFTPAELIRRASDDQSRATNVVTNTQFALFPSFNSYIDGLEIYTNTVGPGDYPSQTVSITLTNVVSGSTYYVYKTSDDTLLGSGTASSSTVTITGVTYVSDFGITVRVRKASSAPKYIPLETQATVNSAGVSVYIGQSVDPVAS